MDKAQVERLAFIQPDDWNGYSFPLPWSNNLGIMSSDEDKWLLLATIGITKRDGETPFKAWMAAVRLLNNISDDEHIDMGFTRIETRRLAFHLRGLDE